MMVNREIKNQGIRDLGEGIKYLKSLESLNIEEFILSTDEGVINKNLKYLPLLKTLRLSFDLSFSSVYQHGIYEDKGIKVANSLKHLLQLRTLDLYFTGSAITDKGLQLLTQEVKYIHSLDHIVLEFNWCCTITDEALESLSQSITALPLLQKLRLVFDHCPCISEEGIISLNGVLKDLSTLQEFRLKCDSCIRVKPERKRALNPDLKFISKIHE